MDPNIMTGNEDNTDYNRCFINLNNSEKRLHNLLLLELI